MRAPIFFLAGLTGSLVCGWFVFPRLLYRTEPQPLRFSHRTHTGEKGGMKCDDCHSFRADGTFTGIPVVDKCAGCHSLIPVDRFDAGQTMRSSRTRTT